MEAAPHAEDGNRGDWDAFNAASSSVDAPVSTDWRAQLAERNEAARAILERTQEARERAFLPPPGACEPADLPFIEGMMQGGIDVPHRLLERVREQYVSAFNKGGRCAANSLLLDYSDRHEYDPLIGYLPHGVKSTPDELREAAEELTGEFGSLHLFITAMTGNSGLADNKLLEEASNKYDVEPPGRETSTQAMRLRDSSYWRTCIRKRLRRKRETDWLLINPERIWYISPDGKRYRRFMDKKSRAWAKRTTIRNKTTGETVANLRTPEETAKAQYAEIMSQARGFAALAKDEGLQPYLVTLTMPSRFHATTTAGQRSRRQNQKYENILPDEAHRQAQKNWRKLRAAMKRRKERLPYHWLMGVQPHKDQTPHYHLVLWYREDGIEEFRELAQRYFADTADGQNGLVYGVDIKPIQQKAGMEDAHEAAVAYISRVVGYAVRHTGAMPGEEGDEELTKASEEALAAREWSTTWGIRKIHTSESGKTVWRYLRRRDIDATGTQAEGMQKAARASDYEQFIRESRRHPNVRIWYDDAENNYGEMTPRAAGVDAGGVHLQPQETFELTFNAAPLTHAEDDKASDRTLTTKSPRVAAHAAPQELVEAFAGAPPPLEAKCTVH